jgi:hypothetical protein
MREYKIFPLLPLSPAAIACSGVNCATNSDTEAGSSGIQALRQYQI